MGIKLQHKQEENPFYCMVHISIQYIINYQIIQQMIKVLGFSYIKSVTQILDWLIFEKSEKVQLDFSHQILWKNLNETFGQFNPRWNCYSPQERCKILSKFKEGKDHILLRVGQGHRRVIWEEVPFELELNVLYT